MDPLFLSKYLLTVAQYRYRNILSKKEKRYYYRYAMKLSYHLQYLCDSKVASALDYVNDFETKQTNRIKDGLFVKPRKALYLACADARDVLEGMRRWDGVEVEKWDFWGNEPKVNLRWV